MLSSMSEAFQERFGKLGVHVPTVLLPNRDTDLYRWAVVACDQHTSEPDYWEEVADVVGGAPSTLGMILPEVYLEEPDAPYRIESIQKAMRDYIAADVVRALEPGFVLTVRSTPHVSERIGLLLALDLEMYDFNPDADSIVRASEQTIVERLPARVRIRKGAPLEMPHILVLIDDPDDLVFGALSETDPPQLYSTQLMLGGGSVTGYHVAGSALEGVATSLETLYGQARGKRPFLFAVGDGNHSLAAAKQVWNEMKPTAPPDHPARYALVEIVNLYDPGLRFEPIHRLVEVADQGRWLEELTARVGSRLIECPMDEMRTALRDGKSTIGYVAGNRCGLIELTESRELPVTIVQEYLNTQTDANIDYIHGWDTSIQLGGRAGRVAILLPEFDPRMLFPTISKRGVLPRKAFSLGEAEEKRYYLEGRLIDL
jgi:uncharacterized protein DUF1015